MLRSLLAAGLLLVALALPVAAGKPAPTGSFEMTPGPYVEGQTVTFDVTTHGVNQQYEVTIGIKCTYPDGTQVEMYNPVRGTYGIYEMTSVRGPWLAPQSVDLWVTGRGYTCRARLVLVHWQKGAPSQVWTVQDTTFTVEP